MLHIIWIILKIILLILAVVLGLALLILALLLLVPVRYEAHLKKKEEFFVEARVHWLLQLVRVPVSFRNGELSAKLKVLIFTVKDFLADEKEIEDGMKEVFADAEEDAGKAAGNRRTGAVARPQTAESRNLRENYRFSENACGLPENYLALLKLYSEKIKKS